MSRDFTPRELLAAESVLGKNQTWRDIEIYWVMADQTTMPYGNRELKQFITSFNYVSRIGYDAVTPLWFEFGGEVISDLIEYLEACLKAYIESSESIDDTISKWFDGGLDENFYYAEKNNEMLRDYLIGKFNVKKRGDNNESVHKSKI